MDKNFDWDGFKRSKFVVHVKTQEEYDELIEACKEHGINFYYSFGESLGEPNFFKIYKENTCIRANCTISYCYYDWYAKCGYKIVEFEQEKELATSTNDTSPKNLYTCYDTTDIEKCQEYLKQIGIMLDSVVLADMGNATDLRNVGVMQVLIRLAIDELNKEEH